MSSTAECIWLSNFRPGQGKKPAREETTDHFSGLHISARNPFARDIGAILHSAPFRRLAHKTQVVLLPQSDFARTRLTHSLEASQIGKELARILARKAGMDAECSQEFEDAVIAACLLHDIGQAPFGHKGERVINSLCRTSDLADGFDANKQNVRNSIETPVRPSLSLTSAVLDGSMKYKDKNDPNYSTKNGAWYSSEDEFATRVMENTRTGTRRSPIAYIVDAADDISYISGDIEDALKLHLVDVEIVLDALDGFLGFATSGAIETKDEWRELVSAQDDSAKLEELKSAVIKGLLRHAAMVLTNAIGAHKPPDWVDCIYDSLASSKGDEYLSPVYSNAFASSSTSTSGSRNLRLKNSIYRDGILRSKAIAEAEFQAEKRLTLLWQSCDESFRNPKGSSAKSLLKLLPNRVSECLKSSKLGNENDRLMVLRDYVSGMTDRFASHMARVVSGHGEIDIV